ncbi:MAG TPA: hypothetical protein VFF16_01090 [Telluria sp.]|nr:hypothetical protein [Telluria sp.]
MQVPEPALPSTPPPLRFSIEEGEVINEFLRDGPVAAHLLLSRGAAPRLIVAFPAGNSAVGLWLDVQAGAASDWSVDQLRPLAASDAAGRPLYGVEALVRVRGAVLAPRQAVLSSARVLRDFQTTGAIPAQVRCKPAVSATRIHWARDRVDGAPGYALTLEVEHGTLAAGTPPSLQPGADGMLHLRVRALCGETPLTPIPLAALLTEPGRGAERVRQSLAFLSYEEKLLAGSWRFNTYFGRDTLMSLAMLMPALTAHATEAALGAVLARLGPDGDVAHEEDIGECACLHPDAGHAPADPICDYKMVDDDFMLAPVVLAYLERCTPAEAAAFLARRSGAGHSFAELITRNLRLVLRRAAPFAQAPAIGRLIALKPGQVTGDWRDSHDGLGGGRYSYNVNAVLVPAALRAIAALAARGELGQEPDFGTAAAMAGQWETHAPPCFEVACGTAELRDRIAAYAGQLGVDAAPALASLAGGIQRSFALSLLGDGTPVPVMHSDFGFALLLQTPPAEMIERELTAIMRPFPAGLMTDVGLLVANAVAADPGLQPLFGPDRYHGAVVWSWQQALLAAGLARQRRRGDLPAATQAMLAAAERTLWAAIRRTREQGNSELWSWRYEAGQYQLQPFGPDCATADESNAAQLWSTVYLAVREPGEPM